MADGKLIIEVYEYSEGSSSIPSFEFIPCKLSTCLNWNKHATLKEIIQKGFDAQPKKLQNTEKRADVLRMLDEANIGRINVAYKPPRPGVDSCIELTNIIQVSMADADATRGKKKNKNDIILYGRYRLTDGNETTILRDAQRITLIFSSHADHPGEEMEEDQEFELQKEICLNITYLYE